MGKELALFCVLHPASVEKKARVISLLSDAKSYYLSPAAKCTTWTYFTPSSKLGVPSDLVPRPETDTLLVGLEIYTDKTALSVQTESDMFKHFHATVQAEELYARPEELTAWYPVAGFVSRRGALTASTSTTTTAKSAGGAVFVLTGLHVCVSGQRDRFVEAMGEYADWVEQNEPGFLTYSIMTRPKAPDEVLVFERCVGPDVFREHTQTQKFRDVLKVVRKYMKVPKGQEWTELDNAFVGNVAGGRPSTAVSKL